MVETYPVWSEEDLKGYYHPVFLRCGTPKTLVLMTTAGEREGGRERERERERTTTHGVRWL